MFPSFIGLTPKDETTCRVCQAELQLTPWTYELASGEVLSGVDRRCLNCERNAQELEQFLRDNPSL